MSEKVITPVARLSFPALFEPKAMEPGQEPKYSATLLFPLDADLSALKKAAAAAAEEKFGAKAKDLIKAGKIKWPIKDQADKSHLQGYTEGSFIAARSSAKPGVVNAALQPIIDPADVFAGVLVRASVSAYAYDHPVGGKGVSFSLNNVMVVRDDGVRFDGRSSPDQDFAEFKDDEPAAAAAGSRDELFD